MAKKKYKEDEKINDDWTSARHKQRRVKGFHQSMKRGIM